jgi:DNA polymerase-3 subunit beta
VLSSVAKNDIRPELSGVFFGFNVYSQTGLTLAATDSYRLAQKIVSVAEGKKDELKIIVPGKTAQEIYRLLNVGVPSAEEIDQKVRLVINGNQIQLHYGTVTLVSRLTEGQYPDYAQIIPKDFKTTAIIPTDQFIKEVKGAGLFTTTGVNAVNCVLEPEKNFLQLSSTSTQTGEYVSEIAGEVKGDKNNILLSFRYVLEGLQHISSPRVVLKMINADSPCILVPDGDQSFLYIVMPIRQ